MQVSTKPLHEQVLERNQLVEWRRVPHGPKSCVPTALSYIFNYDIEKVASAVGWSPETGCTLQSVMRGILALLKLTHKDMHVIPMAAGMTLSNFRVNKNLRGLLIFERGHQNTTEGHMCAFAHAKVFGVYTMLKNAQINWGGYLTNGSGNIVDAGGNPLKHIVVEDPQSWGFLPSLQTDSEINGDA